MATSARRRMMIQGTAAQVASLPAPIGGWNARDSLANMQATDSVQLTNMFPAVSSVNLRGGYQQYATGITGQVESLFNYSGGNAEKLFAVASDKIYDVTAGGAVGAPVVSGLTNARWEYVNVSTPGGSFMYCANGTDAPLLYNGSTWTSITALSSPAITGVTTTTLDNVTLFKNRVWFIQKNTLVAWYLPTSSIAGAAQQIDLSSVARYGGYLVSIGTWTIDAGYGADDNLVFVTSNGEVIAYRGTDPASASTWALIGVWKLGTPIGKRCMFKYAGDLLILTLDGLYPLASAIQSSRLDPRVALSDKIQGAFAEATRTYQANFGWQIFYNSKNNALFVNIPIAQGSQQQQYVMNNITKAWCNFTGWNANCWEIFSDDPYFGGNGFVGKAWTLDYQDDAANIEAITLQAFNYYGSRGVKKYFTRARPSIFTNGQPAIFVGMNVDFDVSDTTAALSFSPQSFGVWDTAYWDSGLWGSGATITNNWQGITGIGYCGSIQMKSASKGLQIEWASTDIVYQTGWAGI